MLYPATDPYLDLRVQEVTDTNDVLLAVEWSPTVSGTVTGVQICLDLSQQEVNPRLPLLAFLWSADGTLLTRGSASEGISFAAPCFYQIGFCCQTRTVQANEHYVVGFWIRGGQYSYVPHGFDNDVSNAPAGHLNAPSNANSTIGSGNGLYVYADWSQVTDTNPPFPAESWENSDYLVSPRFVPDQH
ncbi:hypothetical protein Rhe02_18230 [Rhizocola hellebori]|uniref:DUF4082 domain-containing protein n=1 Tax=Rhizocola hellebori TaxID=1392758 RepID=A0A8J3Q5M3_9ACTN|nr:hypothetical protein Rhe02_18230 [Rhizocola hellebori]